MQYDLRRILSFSLHLDVKPSHSLGPSCAQSLKKGLFRGEAHGKMRDGIAVLFAKLLFSRSKHPGKEPVLQPLHYLAKAQNLNQIHSSANNHRSAPS
jgi:hypothetical protein